LETERISSVFGRPLIAISTGMVMNLSTSTGPSPGELVRICTWTLVTSGTASMGSWRSALRPAPMRNPARMKMSRRFLMEKWMSLSNMAPA
jgi:hypothetical protein